MLNLIFLEVNVYIKTLNAQRLLVGGIVLLTFYTT